MHPLDPGPRDARLARRLLALVLVTYALLATGYALRTPAWQAPDEPAHYNYVAQIAARGCCPVIEPGDWDQAYLAELTAARFRPDLLDRLPSVQYEDHQPPLYYLLLAPVFGLTGGSLVALRLASALIGAGVVMAAFGVARAAIPGRPLVAAGASAFVAFLPQHLAGLAAVNNDGLSELVVGAGLWLIVVLLRGRPVAPWWLGLVVGVGLLTKVNTLFLAGLGPLALLLCWRRASPRALAGLARALVLFALPALALGAIWWARNLAVYGPPDLFGLGAHNAVVADQSRTAQLIADVGAGEYLRRAVVTTVQSFWGQFGWMALPLPGWAYALALAFMAVALVGLALAARGLWRRLSPAGRDVALVLALTIVLAGAQYAYYNLEFWQFQGRYLYPALIPLAIALALGLDGWRAILPRAAVPLARWLPLATGLLAPLSLYLLWRVIPLLAP